MGRTRTRKTGDFTYKVVDASVAKAELRASGGRSSRYDPIFRAAEEMDPTKAITLEVDSYGQVTSLRGHFERRAPGKYNIPSRKESEDTYLVAIMPEAANGKSQKSQQTE